MKANRLVFTLLVLVSAAVFRVSAQQNDEANRNRFEEIKAKAEKGDAKALGQLGDAYLKGEGVRQDLEEAESLFWKAFEKRDILGISWLSWGRSGKSLESEDMGIGLVSC
jgi:hypothetical protein